MWLCRRNDAKDLDMAASDTAGKELNMRMNKKNHTASAKKPMQKKMGGSAKNTAKNDFRQNPFVNLKEEFNGSSGNDRQVNHMSKEDAKHMAELIGNMLEEVFGGDMEGCAGPVIGVIDLDPECMLNIAADKAVKANVRRALINNFGFGGHNGVLAIEACRD